jgi:hypothetical protein
MGSVVVATALNPLPAIVLNSLLIAGFSLLFAKFGAHPIVSVTFAALVAAVLAILVFAMERQFDPVHLKNWSMGFVVYSLGLLHVIDSSLSGEFDDLIFFWLSWAQPCLVMLGINYYRWGKRGERFRVTTRHWFALVVLVAIVAWAYQLITWY